MSLLPLPFGRRPAVTCRPSAIVPLPDANPHLVAAFRAWLGGGDADPDKAIADCLTRLDFYRREQPELVPAMAAEYAALQAALTTEGVAA